MTDIVEPGVHLSSHQLFVFVEVGYSIAIFTTVEALVATCPEVRSGLFQIRLGKDIDGTVEKGQHSSGVLQHLLTTGSTIPHLSLVHIRVRQFYEDVVGLVIFLLGEEDVAFQLSITRLGIDVVGLLYLCQRLVERPGLIGLYVLVDLLVVDHTGITEQYLVFCLCHLQRLFHIFLRCRIVGGIGSNLCAIDISFWGIRELFYHVVHQSHVGGRIDRRGCQVDKQIGLFDGTGQFLFDGSHFQGWVVQTESHHLQ